MWLAPYILIKTKAIYTDMADSGIIQATNSFINIVETF